MSYFPRPKHCPGQAKMFPDVEKQVVSTPQLLSDGTEVVSTEIVDIPLEDISESLPDPDDLKLEKLLAAGYAPEFVNPVLLSKTNAESLRQASADAVSSAIDTLEINKD